MGRDGDGDGAVEEQGYDLAGVSWERVAVCFISCFVLCLLDLHSEFFFLN
jgi:hypothetical protein